jgi:hypothetical protein
MNNLIFLNHTLLFNLDYTLRDSTLFPEYLSIYQSLPKPPGIEYFISRNIDIDLHGPWQLEPTSYPVPSMPARPVTFESAADNFGLTVCQDLECGKQVYLMWSGGIDSTVVAVSILKYIKPSHRCNLHVVLSDFSKHENPIFYHKFLKQFNQIDIGNFDPANINLANSIILDGEGGDQIFGSSSANRFFSQYPEKIMLPWRQNLDSIRSYWHNPDVPGFWEHFLGLVQFTIDQNTVPVETCFDFFWWANFNFKLDATLIRHTLRLSDNVDDSNFKYFAQTVMRRFYTHEGIQQWSMSAGATDKINTAKKTVKWAGRKYIYEFDHNEYYFREKRKEFSKEAASTLGSRYFAIDKNYQRYSFWNRETRQHIGSVFQKNT